MSRTWNVDSIFDVLSNIGGLTVSVVGFFQFCFSPRTEYSYDISRLKRFYYFAKEDHESNNENADLRQKLMSRIT